MANAKDKKFYNSKQWKQVRVNQLQEYPLCSYCSQAGMTTPASCVDHHVAMAAGGEAVDPDNLVSLCWSCHSKKTVRRDGGFGNRSKDDVLVDGCNADGMPLDRNHPWYGGVT